MSLPKEVLALRLTKLNLRIPFFSYLLDLYCLEWFRSALYIYFSSIFAANKNMLFQLFCIDKRKDSTSDLDQERDFQKKMMNVSSGSRGMQRFSVNDWLSFRHLWTLPCPHSHKYTNSGHNCSSRRSTVSFLKCICCFP